MWRFSAWIGSDWWCRPPFIRKWKYFIKHGHLLLLLTRCHILFTKSQIWSFRLLLLSEVRFLYIVKRQTEFARVWICTYLAFILSSLPMEIQIFQSTIKGWKISTVINVLPNETHPFDVCHALSKGIDVIMYFRRALLPKVTFNFKNRENVQPSPNLKIAN